MRKNLRWALVWALAGAVCAFGQGLKDDSQNHRKWQKRRKQRLEKYKDERGKVRNDIWENAVKHFKNMKIAAGVPVGGSAALAKGPAAVAAGSPLTGVQWTQIGPQPAFPTAEANFQGNGPMSGEVLDIAIDPRGTTDQVIYIATNQGGVWRSMDGGVNFEPRTDYFPSLSMGALALDPGNPSIVYAGSGNLFDGNGYRFHTLSVKAIGIYKSTDMGETWSVLNPGGIFSGNGINRMVMPAPNVLLVAAGNGLYRSVDGGLNFGNNSPMFNNGSPLVNGFISDLDLDVADPANRIYASVSSSGIRVSTDGGITFPAASDLFDNPGGPASPGFIALAQAESNALRMYATVDGTSFGIYRTDDGGANWARQAAADGAFAANGGCQCGYDQTIGVDPLDQNRVYIGFQELYLSTDGAGTGFGSPAISRNKIHWDHHYVGFSPPSHRGAAPAAPTRMWVGTDGGIHSSTDGGTTFNNDHNIGIATNLFTDMAMGTGSAANNAFTYGGTQDTGTLHHNPGVPNAPGANRWNMQINGDGGGVGVDTADANRAYGGGNNGYILTNDGGVSWSAPGGANVPPFSWRYAIDFNDENNVFVIESNNSGFDPGTDLWRSTDRGVMYTELGGFNPPTTVFAIANTPADSNVLWFGLNDGRVMYTTNALAAVPTYTGPITVTGSTGGVSDLVVNPLNSAEVVVTYRGVCGGACSNPNNRLKRVFRTVDQGASWTDISGTDGNPIGNLPNLPVNSVVYDTGTTPPTIVISNDSGVLRSANNGQTWEVLGVGLPTVDGTQLRIDNGSTPPLLRLATYGRSMFELTAADGPLLAVNADLGFGALCLGGRATRVVQMFNVGSEDLVINAFFRLSGSTDFRIISGPSTPVVIPPGGEINFTVEYTAITQGDQTAIFQINSNDQFEPAKQLFASGTGNSQMITTVISGAGNFGDVCEDTFKDLTLTIANVGCGSLSVSNIVSSSSQFEVAQVMSYPLTISAGNSIEVPIRFEPDAALACGDTRNATLTISNNDPAVPSKMVNVQATVPCGDLNVAIANSGDFGNVCNGDQKDLNLTLFNQGKCNVNISNITSSNGNFVLPSDLQLPLVLSHDADFNLPIRFSPNPEEVCDDDTPREGVITIVSDSPGESPLDIDVSGSVPCPNLVIDPVSLTQIYSFPATVVDTGEVLGCFTERPFVIRNTGACPLTIDDMNTGGSDDFSVVAPTQFPIVLPGGEETLTGKIRFTPQSGGAPRVADGETLGTLTIVTDDPDAAGTAPLCGEGVVQSGIRFLVTNVSTGTPVAIDGVDDIRVTSKGRNTPSPYSVRFTNQAVQGPVAMCGNSVSYHADLEELPSAATTGNNPKASYEVSVKEGNLQTTETFSIGQCDFIERQFQLTSQGGGGKGGGKPPKP